MPAFRNWLASLGSPEDPVATDVSSSWSAISLLKAVYKAINDGTFAASFIGQAQGFAAVAQGSFLRSANYFKLARAAAVSTAADAVTTAAQAGLAIDAANRVMGMALVTDRAKKAQLSASASAAAAAASAASITPEGLVLSNQVYS